MRHDLCKGAPARMREVPVWWSMALALAAEPSEPTPESLEQAIEEIARLEAELDAARARTEATTGVEEEVGRLEALVDAGRRLLDDRIAAPDRVAAADELGRLDDDRALWFLRAGAGTRSPEVQQASARAALAYRGSEAVAVAERVLTDRSAPRAMRTTVVVMLGEHASDDAAEVLRSVVGNRDVPARVRSDALTTLQRRYPEYVAANPTARSVADPLGGVMFVTSNGVAGGILLSSVGVWGAFEGAPAIGAVGGSAIGLGTGALIARNRPFTTAQGLAYTSGVSWGLTYGLWTTTAIHGGWRHLNRTNRVDERRRAINLGAAYRAVGVGAGTALGALALRNDPTVSDVMEVDTAGYLGSAMALGATGLLFYRQPDGSTSTTNYGGRYDSVELNEYRYRASRWLEASSLVGATAGLATGMALRSRWDLDGQDLAFAGVLGGEAAWFGLFLPAAIGIDGSALKGSTRLPSHAAMTAGLIVSELHPIPLRRSAVTMVGSIGGNAIGAGMPLLLGNDDPQPLSISMISTGVAATAGAFAASSWMHPDGGDWAMVTMGSLVGTIESALIGGGLYEVGAFRRPFQTSGLTLVGGGVASLGLTALTPVVDPDPSAMVVLGTAAVWGGTLGALVPVAAGVEDQAENVLFPAAAGSALVMTGAGVAMLPSIGMKPSQTVIPQLAGLTGGTTGALVAALPRNSNGNAVALGALIGSVAGFVGGSLFEASRDRPDPVARAQPYLQLPGRWSPGMSTWIDSAGQAVPMVTLQGAGL